MPTERIGRYDVEGVLGAGGFATVYRANDPRLDATVAIKVLAENWSLDPDVRRRFRTEAVLLRRLQSQGSVPGLIEVHDIDETEDGRPFFVMGFADRGTLRHRVGEQAWAPQHVVPVIDALASAVGAIHRAGVVHRDLKPSNLLVRTDRGVLHGDPDGLLRPGERLVVGDLGLAKDLNVDTTALSVAGGTARYSAPEQLDPAGSVDHRADIYAVTVLVSELLRGPEGAAVQFDPLTDQVLAKGHAQKADDRFNSMADWRSALLDALGAPNQNRRTGEVPSVRPPVAAAPPAAPQRPQSPGITTPPPTPAATPAPPMPQTAETVFMGADSQPSFEQPVPADVSPTPTPIPAAAGNEAGAELAAVATKQKRSRMPMFALLALALVALGGFGFTRLAGESSIIGPDTIAVGEMVRYRADAPPDAQIEWTDWTGASIAEQDLQVQARLPGSLSFSLVVDGRDPETKTISVVPSDVGPTIDGPDEVPQGQVTQFLASTEPGDVRFFWLDEDGNRLDQEVFSLTPDSTDPVTFSLISVGADGIERGIRKTVEVSG